MCIRDWLGLRQVTLLLNSLGNPDDRSRYVDALTAHFSADADALSEESRTTLATNPLRVLDSRRPEDADLVEQAVGNVLESGLRTGDIMQPGMTEVSCTRMGEAVTEELDKLAG